jgi:hypothetical protein
MPAVSARAVLQRARRHVHCLRSAQSREAAEHHVDARPALLLSSKAVSGLSDDAPPSARRRSASCDANSAAARLVILIQEGIFELRAPKDRHRREFLSKREHITEQTQTQHGLGWKVHKHNEPVSTLSSKGWYTKLKSNKKFQ